MQLKNRDGIACDQCGTTYKSDFLYYSFDFRLVPVHENRRQSLDRIFSIPVIFSLDICTQCFDKIKNTVIANYGKNMTADVRHRGKAQIGILCELSGEKMAGTFNFYHCNIIKVDVTMSGQPSVCVKCQTKTYEENKPCNHCGGRDFIKPASTKAEDRFLEINVCETTFHDMVKRAEAMQKIAGEWATQS
tara:strand:- start:87 stop:656 length:570 start_codon:yes stop_codon:yes gene_type:complete